MLLVVFFLFFNYILNLKKYPKNKKDLRDQSGVRFYTTTNYRKNEGDVFGVGTGEGWQSLIIPPKADHFEAYFGCSSECIDVR